jgi:signal transduction histidine kinase
MSGLAERVMGLEARWLDPALAAIFLVALEIELLTAPYRRGPLVLNALVIAMMTLPLAWRRRAPLHAALVILGATLLEDLALTDVTRATTTFFVLIVPPYSVAAWLDRRRAVAGLVACMVTALTASLLTGSAQQAISSTIFVSVSWATGRAMRARRLLARELKEKASRAEAEREDRARLAVAIERTRIARELQAVVAHNVSGMVVGAEAAWRLLDADPVGAESQMVEIERIGRQALDEMRRILGVLRSEEGPELEPQPGMGQLPALVERSRAAGLAIDLRVDGEPAPLPGAVDLAAYRILQEGLANALENAEGRAAMIVRYGAARLELELGDDGPAEGRLGDESARALRERAAMSGGEVRWGARSGGGFAIRATLPSAFDELGAERGEDRPQDGGRRQGGELDASTNAARA